MLKFFLYLYIFVEAGTCLFWLSFKFNGDEIPAYLANKPDSPHSVYFMPSFDAPYSGWTHRKTYIDGDG